MRTRIGYRNRQRLVMIRLKMAVAGILQPGWGTRGRSCQLSSLYHGYSLVVGVYRLNSDGVCVWAYVDLLACYLSTSLSSSFTAYFSLWLFPCYSVRRLPSWFMVDFFVGELVTNIFLVNTFYINLPGQYEFCISPSGPRLLSYFIDQYFPKLWWINMDIKLIS